MYWIKFLNPCDTTKQLIDSFWWFSLSCSWLRMRFLIWMVSWLQSMLESKVHFEFSAIKTIRWNYIIFSEIDVDSFWLLAKDTTKCLFKYMDCSWAAPKIHSVTLRLSHLVSIKRLHQLRIRIFIWFLSCLMSIVLRPHAHMCDSVNF